MNPIRAIIVEDEPSGLENLRYKLNTHCPGIEIIAECTSGEMAIPTIKRMLPDVIFLDIRLGDMTGFDVLKAIRHPSFEIIFTTSYDEYAIEAIKNSALDYLLKPIEVDELMDAVAKLRNKHIQQPRQAPVVANPNNKIGFPVSTGQQFIDVKDIIYAKAEDNVCLLQLVDHSGEKVGNAVKSNMIRLTKSLGWVEAKLEDYSFCRVHHSYLINFQQMTEYIRNDGGYVIMSNGKAVSISRRRKDDFLDKLDQWSGNKD